MDFTVISKLELPCHEEKKKKFWSYLILLTFFSCLLQNKHGGLYPCNKHPITVIYTVEQSQFNYIITLRNDMILYIFIDINMNSNKKFCNKINMQRYEK